MKAVGSTWGRVGIAALCAAILACLAWCAHPGQLEELSGAPKNTDYNLLVRGFQAGELSLDLPAPPGLRALPDPYDPAANSSFRNGVPPLHDLTYWKGRLYLYFGVTPALVLFWPFAALTRHYLWEWQGAAILVAIGFLTGAAILCNVRVRYFPAASRSVLALGIVGFGIATGLPLLLSRTEVYEVAIGAGFAFMTLAGGAFWMALHQARQRGCWFLAMGLALGLALGARPIQLPAVAGMAAAAAVWIVRRVPTEGETGHAFRDCAVLLGPITGLGLGLLAYNYARFGQAAEFGQHYQLGVERQDARSLFDLHSLAFNLRVYWLQPMKLTAHFPFVSRMAVPPPTGHAPLEDPYGLLLSVPFLGFALAIPAASWGRTAIAAPLRLWLASVAIAGGASALAVALYYVCASRYEVEFAAPLGLLAGCGVLAMNEALTSRPGLRTAAVFGCAAVLTLSCAFELLASVAHYAEAQNDYAAALTRLGRGSEAVPILRRMVRLKTDFPAAHVNLGNALIRSGGLAEAEAEFAAALRLDPDNFEARNNLAEALTQSGRFDQAAAQYAQAIKLRPNSAQLHSHRSYALMHAGRPEEALEEIEAAARASNP